MDDTQDHVSEKGVEATSLNLIPPETVLVVVRSGILKHTLPVAVTTQPMVINQDIKALILKPALIPDYLGLYLSILGHKLLPTISKHSTTVQSINTEQFNSLLIPVPSLDIQHRLVSEMQAARATSQQKLAQAETLLAGLDGYLLERLGLTLPTENKQKAFAIQMRQIQGKRIDALAYRPYYDAKNQLPETPTRPLGEIAYTA